jgi:hypothetical protein
MTRGALPKWRNASTTILEDVLSTQNSVEGSTPQWGGLLTKEFEIRLNPKTTERDSNSPILIAATTYSFCQREYCYEEGPSRGAFCFSTDYF